MILYTPCPFTVSLLYSSVDAASRLCDVLVSHFFDFRARGSRSWGVCWLVKVLADCGDLDGWFLLESLER